MRYERRSFERVRGPLRYESIKSVARHSVWLMNNIMYQIECLPSLDCDRYSRDFSANSIASVGDLGAVYLSWSRMNQVNSQGDRKNKGNKGSRKNNVLIIVHLDA